MRHYLLVVCALAASHFLRADPGVYHVSVLADTDRTEGGDLATLIADDLRRSKDIIMDDKSPDLTVSCFAIHPDSSDVHAARIAASVAIMSGQCTLLQHFALTADSLQSLAHKAASEFNKRELDSLRRADAGQKLDQLPRFARSQSGVARLTRFAGNPIINYGGGGWKDSQVQEPVVITDPTDSSKLIMIFAAMAAPVGTGVMSIGLATATTANPYDWTEYASNPWINDTGRRMDSAVVEGSQVTFYSTVANGSRIDAFVSTNLTYATANAGTANHTLHSGVLTPSGDETYVGEAAVIKEGSTYYMLYTYSTSNQLEPGCRLATSSDGLTWTKQGNVITVGAAGSPDAAVIEGGQLLKVGSKYVFSYNAFNGPADYNPGATKLWTVCMAVADSPGGPFIKAAKNPIFTGNGVSAPDRWSIANPTWFNVGSRWYLLYQASAQDPATRYYFNSNWSMCIASLNAGHTPLDFYRPADFTPGNVPTLQAWYKADALTLNDNDAVGTWPDSSGRGRDASQTTAGNKPTYKTGIVNGKPVVRFDGVDDFLTIAREITINDFTVFVVYRTSGNDVTVSSATLNNQFFAVDGSTNKYAFFDGANPVVHSDTLAASRTSWNDACAKRSGSTVSWFEKSVARNSGSANGTTRFGMIGSVSNLAYTTGDIAEILFYNSALSDTDRQNIESYLASKYGI
jgi:hypothetical protein